MGSDLHKRTLPSTTLMYFRFTAEFQQQRWSKIFAFRLRFSTWRASALNKANTP